MNITTSDGNVTLNVSNKTFEVIDNEDGVVIRTEHRNKLGAFTNMVVQLWADWEMFFGEDFDQNNISDRHQFQQVDMLMDLLNKTYL